MYIAIEQKKKRERQGCLGKRAAKRDAVVARPASKEKPRKTQITINEGDRRRKKKAEGKKKKHACVGQKKERRDK